MSSEKVLGEEHANRQYRGQIGHSEGPVILDVYTSYPPQEPTQVERAYEFLPRQDSVLLFTETSTDEQEFSDLTRVIKIITPEKDKLYGDTRNPNERYNKLVKSYAANKLFSPEVYLGTVRIAGADWDWQNDKYIRSYILTDEFQKVPPPEPLDSQAHYAILMDGLRPESLLANRFLTQSREELWPHLQAVNNRIVTLHEHPLSIAQEEQAILWGSSLQLRNKLEENLYYMRDSFQRNKELGAFQGDEESRVIRIMKDLRNKLRSVFTPDSIYQTEGDFEKRMGFVGRMHGDFVKYPIYEEHFLRRLQIFNEFSGDNFVLFGKNSRGHF